MKALSQTHREKLKSIQPLLAEIDLRTDCTPTMIGAYNTVVASGGEVSDFAMKLILLKKKGVIDMEEYVAFVRDHAAVQSSVN